MSETPVGKVKHFFNKISVAVIELSAPVKVGDKLKFKHGGYEFEQIIESMQIEHKQIKSAKKGQAIGMKTQQPVHENTKVLKVEE